ncbi:MAG: 30S ribosomal protein S16, partial [Candidatus Omnitrophota bacterium]
RKRQSVTVSFKEVVMAVVIRLKSTGTKKKIKHRIVVTDSKFPRDGRVLEEVGHWDPSKDPQIFGVKADRVKHWISMGAKPSDTVRSILKKAGVK